MTQEIERKFLVKEDPLPFATESRRLTQGYLAHDREEEVSVRVRTIDDKKAILGIKKRLSKPERAEFEFEVPISESVALIREIVGSRLVEKTRYLIPAAHGYTWEVDVFHGKNQGLVVAEIELPHEDAPFDRPGWLGEEVTADDRYLNHCLAHHPFQNW